MKCAALKTMLAGALLLAACQKEADELPTEFPAGASQIQTPPSLPPFDKPPASAPLSVQERIIVAGATDFAFRLFSVLRTKDQNRNLVFSPFSVSTALTMAFNGAHGTTRQGMRQTLGFGQLSEEQINSSFKSLQQRLASRDKTVVFTSANGIWHDRQISLKPPFVAQNKSTFEATVQGLDFQSPGAKDVMNDWVKEKTQGKVTDIVEQIKPEHVMFLINALYFQAYWTYPFDKEATHKRSFRREDGSSVMADFMALYNGKYLYYEDAGISLVDLPYGNGQFSMTLLMPTGRQTVSDLARELSSARLAGWLSQADTTRLRLRMPRFGLKYRQELREALTQMGMGEVFSNQADFSRMATPVAGRLKVSEVMHKTVLGVDEEGSEAAAATSVGFEALSYSPSIHIDRPFIFLIREKSSNVILFLGQLMDP